MGKEQKRGEEPLKSIVEIRGLRKKYGNTLALDNVSLDIYPGITGFVGPNGAGKTTLINILTGLISADGGTVSIHSEDDFRKHMGVVRDRVSLPPELEVEFFLTKVVELYGGDVSRVKNVIKLTGLEDVRHRKIGELSMGFKKRVGIAQAVVHEPELIIADEPFTQLDPVIKVEIRDMLARLNKEEGINFFISSHDIADLELIADRVILINHGKIVREIVKSESMSVIVLADDNENLMRYLKSAGYSARRDGTQVRVGTNDLNKLLVTLGNYSGRILGVNMSSIEGVMKDEIKTD